MSRMSRLTEATLATSAWVRTVCGPSERVPAPAICEAVMTMSPPVSAAAVSPAGAALSSIGSV